MVLGLLSMIDKMEVCLPSQGNRQTSEILPGGYGALIPREDNRRRERGGGGGWRGGGQTAQQGLGAGWGLGGGGGSIHPHVRDIKLTTVGGTIMRLWRLFWRAISYKEGTIGKRLQKKLLCVELWLAILWERPSQVSVGTRRRALQR